MFLLFVFKQRVQKNWLWVKTHGTILVGEFTNHFSYFSAWIESAGFNWGHGRLDFLTRRFRRLAQQTGGRDAKSSAPSSEVQGVLGRMSRRSWSSFVRRSMVMFLAFTRKSGNFQPLTRLLTLLPGRKFNFYCFHGKPIGWQKVNAKSTSVK